MEKIDFDDKDIGIIALVVVAVFSLLVLGAEAREIAISVVSAIAGIVTGRRLDMKKGGEK